MSTDLITASLRDALTLARCERDAALAEVDRLKREVGALIHQRAGLDGVRKSWRTP